MAKMHAIVAAAIILLLHEQVTAYYVFRGRQGRQPRCSSASKPCRMKATLEGPVDEPLTVGTRSCQCASKSCPNNWTHNNAARIIDRRLLTDNQRNMSVRMMFCHTVRPTDICRRSNIALVVKGMAHIPMEVDFINCTCPYDEPLMLSRQWQNYDYLTYSSYICSSHMTDCQVSGTNPEACSSTERGDLTNVSYPCRCPTGYECLSSNIVDISANSYCMPENTIQPWNTNRQRPSVSGSSFSRRLHR